MHATFEQLIELVDGGAVATESLEHVEHCRLCQQELAGIRDLRRQLRALPGFAPPPAGWQAVRACLERPRGRRRQGRLAFAAALALAAAGLGWLALGPSAERPSQTAALADPPVSPELERLQARSQHLEDALHRLPARQVTRLSTAGTIAQLEDRLWLVDSQLGAGVHMSEEERRLLWRARVELMNSLLEVRYAELTF